MKKIEAIIRKSKFFAVKEALHQVGVNFFSYWDVTGVGNEKEGHVYRGISYSTSDIQRRYLSIVVNNDFEEVIAWQLEKMGTSIEEMRKIGVKHFPRTSGPLFLKEGEKYEFPTESGKIELYSKQLKSLGFDPMPNYTKHPEPPQGFYRLNYGRAPMHTFSRTANNPNLNDLKSENDLWVNPKVARILGLRKGQEVWLRNQDEVTSTFSIKVRVTERVRWDSVYMVHGFGHDNKKLSRAYGKGINDTQLISKVAVDPIMGGTGMRGNFVEILTENPHKTVEI